MKRRLYRLAVRPSVAALVLAGTLLGGGAVADDPFESGTPVIRSMSALAFGPDGVLFVGDGKGGAIVAIDTGDTEARGNNEAVNIRGIEEKIAARFGARAVDVMIHDLAVNPVSQNIYLAVSRGRGKWDSRWLLPNDVADATVLLRINPEGAIDEVFLTDVRHARVELPNPVDAEKSHMWKDGISMRADTITDMAFAGDSVWVTGLSNEEFASTAWRIPWPFGGKVTATTLEVFHGAHGEYETHAPIRTFVPYRINDDDQILAAYLCTPLVTFPTKELKDGRHVKGRTVAEMGSGNYPLDMVVYEKDGEDRLLIANSNLPFMIIDPDDIAAYEGSITTEVEGYVAGVPYEPRSGVGILQMDKLNPQFILALQRLPGGTMDLVSLSVRRF
jgi:hypothetical protein